MDSDKPRVEASFFYTFAGTTIHMSVEDESDALVKEWATRFPEAVDVLLGNKKRDNAPVVSLGFRNDKGDM